MELRDGDILVSRLPAAVEHELHVVAGEEIGVCPSQESAVVQAEALAEARSVDVWLTEDHIHFLKVASHRQGGSAG